MANTVRIGDSVTCGDFSAQGSANVFANNLPITNKGQRTTTGHGCFPPTVFIGPYSTSVFVNNQPVVLKGKTKIQAHCCGHSCHDGSASSGSPNVAIEA